jgi:phosphatidylinositol alpha-mannosyltransferase
MKIGIVCPYNIFRYGGVQETVFEHQRILKKRGHDVLVISPRPASYDGPVPADVRLIGISTDLNYPFKTKADVSIRTGQKEMKELLKKEHFDILHFHEPWVPLFPRQLLNISQAVNIATFHAKLPEKLIFKTIGKAIKPYTKSIINDLDFMAAASEPASRHINEIAQTSVPIIFNGIDLSKYSPAKVKPLAKYNDDIKTIVYINRLEKRKGPDLLLAAYREFTKQNKKVRLVIASDGDMRSRLESYVYSYKLPNVEFLGFIDDKTKIRLYASADLFCAPSPYGEGFGIVLLEAMAMGVPYVAGDNSGYRYASADRADKYLINPYKPKLFAKKIDDLLFDQDERDSYRKWAKRYVKQFDYEKVVSQYERIYKKLMADKRGKS